jgi:hypothetical protein
VREIKLRIERSTDAKRLSRTVKLSLLVLNLALIVFITLTLATH